MIREVERGEGVLITRRGRPVAKLVPHLADKTEDPEWASACERMMTKLDEGASLGGLKIERAELYDRQGQVLARYEHSRPCRRP